MDKELLEKAEQLFNQAILMAPRKRDAFVKLNTAGNSALYDEVTSLITSDGASNAIFEKPAFPMVAQLLEDEYYHLLEESDFGAYKLQKILGRGGMGCVFLAVDTRLERSVAVKILPKSITENSKVALHFQYEAKIASAISHQNIAHIYEYGKCREMHFLAMEYIPGKTLRQLLKERQIDLLTVVDIALQVCSALKAAHKQNIIHRDIKPENIMITDDYLIKVVDFGIAKISEKESEENTEPFTVTTGSPIGTVGYMSPEQVRGHQIDARTDLWSLGVLLYEMLTGNRPFDGETSSDVQTAILSKEPQPVEITDEIPKLEKLIAKALSKNISKRYQTADKFLTDLKIIQRDVYDYSKQKER